MILAIAALAKRRRSNRNFVAIPFETDLTLGTLALNAVLTTGLLDSSFDDDIYIISADVQFNLRNQTDAEGPIHVGLAHSDYSVTEILEFLDVDPTERHDLIAQERVRRGKRIRKFGGFRVSESTDVHFYLAHGEMIRKPMKFAVNEGKQVNVYAVNRGSGVSTGRVVNVSGTLFCRWIS